MVGSHLTPGGLLRPNILGGLLRVKVRMYSLLDGVEWSASRYGRFNLYPLNRGLGGFTNRPRRREFIASAGKRKMISRKLHPVFKTFCF